VSEETPTRDDQLTLLLDLIQAAAPLLDRASGIANSLSVQKPDDVLLMGVDSSLEISCRELQHYIGKLHLDRGLDPGRRAQTNYFVVRRPSAWSDEELRQFSLQWRQRRERSHARFIAVNDALSDDADGDSMRHCQNALRRCYHVLRSLKSSRTRLEPMHPYWGNIGDGGRALAEAKACLLELGMDDADIDDAAAEGRGDTPIGAGVSDNEGVLL
jgi:hypothetical protein